MTTMLAELIDPDGRVDSERWSRAHSERTPVALCGCRGLVVTNPDEPPTRVHFGVVWYSMRCENCGHETEVTGSRKMPTVPRTSLALLERHAAVERRKLAEA